MKYIQPQIKIETQRLILVPVSWKYKGDIFAEFTPEITRYMPFTPGAEDGEIQEFLVKARLGLINGTDIVLAILDKEREEFIGCCGIQDISVESIELGLWLKAGTHGKGFGTEVVESLVKFIELNFRYSYLIYPVDKENIASRKIPEKLGFSVFKEYQVRKGENTFLNIMEYRKYSADHSTLWLN